MSQVWTVIILYFRFGKKIPTWITVSQMFILQSRSKIGFMLKTVEKMADRGTLVRLKEIRPSTGNDVTIQIFNYKIFYWIIHLYRSFLGLTYVFQLKPISLIVFKWQHGKEWQKIAPILGTTNYLSYYQYYVCMSYKTTRVSKCAPRKCFDQIRTVSTTIMNSSPSQQTAEALKKYMTFLTSWF